MKNIFVFVLMTFVLGLSFSSCKKETDNNSASLSFEKTDYVSKEMSQLSVNALILSSTEYSGKIDDNIIVTLKRVDNALVFIMPELSAGIHNLKITIDNKDYIANFNITVPVTIADPNTVIASSLTSYNNQLTILNQMLDSLSGVDSLNLLNDLQIIQGYIDNANQLLATASIEEKQYAAQMIQANQGWTNEINNAISNLTIASQQLRNIGVNDYEAKVEQAMRDFVEAKITLIQHIPKIVLWTSTGFLVGNGIGAAIGAGISLGILFSDLEELNISIENLLDVAFTPFQNMFAERLAMNGNLSISQTKNNVSFTLGQPKPITVTQDYRSVYNGDANSTIPIVRSFVSGLVAIKNAWDDLMSTLPDALSFGPKTVDGISTYVTENIQVHSNYLSISNVSNSDLTYQIDRTNGYFNITFNGNVNGTVNFTFQINYNNSRFGTQSYLVSAALTGTTTCGTPTTVVDVTNPITGKTWMDRNLGASRAALSSTDSAAYGDLYQWGRGSDGHQCRTSPTTSILSSTDQPSHGNFISNSNYSNWRSPQNSNLWQGVNGVNNPCPTGYRIPTEQEFDAERLSWSVNTSLGAFASPLKLPTAGARSGWDGSLHNIAIGDYWSSSSTLSGLDSHYFRFDYSIAYIGTQYRINGSSVRCIKD
jgi:hypothetical protein